MKAGDLTQDVFVWLIHHAEDFDPARGEMAAFLIGVARKLLQRQQRDLRRWLPLMEVNRQQQQTEPDRNIEVHALRRAIARLPLRYREAVVLCELEEK